jgi:hypothetical protein
MENFALISHYKVIRILNIINIIKTFLCNQLAKKKIPKKLRVLSKLETLFKIQLLKMVLLLVKFKQVKAEHLNRQIKYRYVHKFHRIKTRLKTLMNLYWTQAFNQSSKLEFRIPLFIFRSSNMKF